MAIDINGKELESENSNEILEYMKAQPETNAQRLADNLNAALFEGEEYFWNLAKIAGVDVELKEALKKYNATFSDINMIGLNVTKGREKDSFMLEIELKTK